MYKRQFLGYTLVIRTAGNPAALAEAVRRQIHELDPSMAIFNDETMEEHIRAAYFLPRLAATLFGTFGFIGLVLATVGLYGVMSYAVTRRTREMCIRDRKVNIEDRNGRGKVIIEYARLEDFDSLMERLTGE